MLYLTDERKRLLLSILEANYTKLNHHDRLVVLTLIAELNSAQVRYRAL